MSIRIDEVEKYREKNGPQRTSALLKVLSRQFGFIEAVESTVGKELLNNSTIEADFLLGKIVSLEASDEEKMRFKVLRDILTDWLKKIDAYQQNIKKLKEGK